MNKENKKTFWAEHIEAQKISGLNQSQYCKQNNLKPHHFSYWKNKINRTSVSGQPGFIPINVNNELQNSIYCTIEYATGIKIKIQNKEMLDKLPELLANKF